MAFHGRAKLYRVVGEDTVRDAVARRTYHVAVLAEKIDGRGQVFRMGGAPVQDLPLAGRDREMRAFYAQLATDDWGRHFVKRETLHLPIEEIGRRSGVRVHFISDLDHDGRLELWVTYRLADRDPRGYVLYEQSAGRPAWREIATLCVDCE